MRHPNRVSRIAGVLSLALLAGTLAAPSGAEDDPESLWKKGRDSFEAAEQDSRLLAAAKAAQPGPARPLAAEASAPVSAPSAAPDESGLFVLDLRDGGPASAIKTPPAFSFELAELDNKSLRAAKHRFDAKGLEVRVSGGLDPADAKSSFIVMQTAAGDTAAFDMRAIVTSGDKPTRLTINGQRLLLQGDPDLWKKFLSPDEAVFSFSEYALADGGKVEPGRALLTVVLKDLSQAVFDSGAALRAGDEEYRVLFGDAVSQSGGRRAVGPGKVLVIMDKKGGKLRMQMADAARLKEGTVSWVSLSAKTEVGLVRGADSLSIHFPKENKR